MGKRAKEDRPREKLTLIPTFDPQELAMEIEQESRRDTALPPFDPSSYARIVEEGALDAPRAMSPEAPPEAITVQPPAEARSTSLSDTPAIVRREATEPTMPEGEADPEAIGREMYASYLSSDFPAALALAERVLAHAPGHALAELVANQCRDRLVPNGPALSTLSPKSVLRLKVGAFDERRYRLDPTSSFVLGHVDGVSDAATVAALTGLPDLEALNRLHALLDLGVLEVVNG